MGAITVVGLGPGAAGYLSLETIDLLESGVRVILRTERHPTVEWLREQDIEFTSCDAIYEQEDSFEKVYEKIAEYVLAAADKGDVVYAVPGSPFVAERTVTLLLENALERKIKIDIWPAMSFLDLAYGKLNIDPVAGLRIIDAVDSEAVSAAGSYPIIVTQVYSRLVASDLKIALMDVLDDAYPVYFLRNLGLPDEECRKIKLYELDRQQGIDHLTSIFVPAEAEESPGTAASDPGRIFDIQPLAEVIRRLRSPGGCPWDIEQTHDSIRSNMIEEVYEYLEAVDDRDFPGMCEELGDILMQVVFHARMAEEAGNFNLQDVINEVTEKLIRRHPHVFGDLSVAGSDEVLRNWEAIKKLEKTERTHILDGVGRGLPALLRAYKMQGKAAKAGFDWSDKKDVWKKVKEELEELQEALEKGDFKASESELGDVLFALVNYARHNKIEPETALNGTNNRFASRFGYVEQRVKDSGREWKDFTLAELDTFWDEAKAKEREGNL